MKRTLRGACAVPFLALCLLSIRPARAVAAGVIDVGGERQLFVDGALVASLEGGAELRLHHPVPQGVVLTEDKPWEGNATCYNSVFQDRGLYRMYYRGWTLPVTAAGSDDHAIPQVVCYAESADGITWRRPNLGLHDFHGSKDNNIVFVGDHLGPITFNPGNEAVFRDTNPAAPAAARYKTFRTGIHAGLVPFQSPDGLHWTPMTQSPVIVDSTRNAFDSQECAFWDAVRRQYRVYWRFYDPAQGGRSIRTSTSPDFVHWGDRQDLTYVDSPREELYENCIKPYERAPEILIGFPTRYVERGWSDSMRALPDPENRRMRAGDVALSAAERKASAVPGSPEAMSNGLGAVTVHERYGTALTEGLVMASRDGVRFKRWNEAFMRPGIERTGTWNYGQTYIGWHLVETRSALPGAPNELSLYATEDYWTGAAAHLRRYTLRLDGFVSVRAPLRGGALVTKPIRFQGGRLFINFSTSAAGGIRVAVEDADGAALPDFGLADCPVIFGDAIDRPVTWNGGGDLAALAGRPVRLRFELKDADLYAFQFRN